jgi:hypothetical protein
MPAIVLFAPDGGENASWFSCFQNDDDLVGLGAAEVGFDKLIAATFRRFQDWGIPFLRTILRPVLKLLGDVAYTSRLTGY